MSQIADQAEEMLDELLAARSWSLSGELAREGCATRVHIELGDDPGAGLLYLWDDPICAERAAWAHHDDHAAVLFAVPSLVEAGEGWCLVEDVEGTPLTQYLAEQGAASIGELDGERARALAREAGELARKLHEVEVPPQFGDVAEGSHDDRTGHLGQWNTFNGYVAHRLEHFAEQIRHRQLDEDVRSQLLATIGDLRSELAAFHPRHTPSINHGAFGPQHFWVDPSGRTITALTGFGRTRLLPPEADLARMLWLDGLACDDVLVRAFYAGYGAARTMDLQRRERFYRRLAALEALVDSTGRGGLSDADLVELTLP